LIHLCTSYLDVKIGLNARQLRLLDLRLDELDRLCGVSTIWRTQGTFCSVESFSASVAYCLDKVAALAWTHPLHKIVLMAWLTAAYA